MEYWRNGVLEEWSIGGMEYRTAERDRGRRSSEFQHSNTPILQHSNTPQELQNETAPFPSVDGD